MDCLLYPVAHRGPRGLRNGPVCERFASLCYADPRPDRHARQCGIHADPLVLSPVNFLLYNYTDIVMKHLSKALAAISFLAGASALHAQTSYYGTNFDGTAAAYPYTDGSAYNTGTQEQPGNGFYDINGEGSPAWTGTGGYAITVDTGVAAGAQSISGFAAVVYSGNGTAVATHSITALATTGPTAGFYNFNTDFQISGNGDAAGDVTTAPGDTFAFNLTSTTGNVISVSFVPTQNASGTEGAPNLALNGVVTSNGPQLNQRLHLTIAVQPGGNVSVFLGGVLTATATIANTASVTGFSITETDATTTNTNNAYDSITFDQVNVVVPEPSTYAMMGLGLVGMLGLMRFRRAKL